MFSKKAFIPTLQHFKQFSRAEHPGLHMAYLTLAREHSSSSDSLQMAPPAKAQTSRPGVTGVCKMCPISTLTTATSTGPSRYLILEPNTFFPLSSYKAFWEPKRIFKVLTIFILFFLFFVNCTFTKNSSCL